MVRSWVTFKDKFGTVLHSFTALDIEMDNVPRQGEEVIIHGTSYGVYGVKWEIIPETHAYRGVTVYLDRGRPL